MKKKIQLVLLSLLVQQITFSQNVVAVATYPQVKGYASIVHPVIIIDKHRGSFNFNGSYTVGFPFGINLLKSDNLGFSFELTPIIKADSKTSKVTSILFHPGMMFRFHHGFTFIQRLAFETNGRYGLTPVFNQVIINKPFIKYFVAVPVPIRFGNNVSATLSPGVQFGISF